MIIAQRKPFPEIAASLADHRRVLVAGCGTCVAVCLAGGEKEAGILASQLTMESRLAGREQKFDTACVERQCDAEFLEELTGLTGDYDAVLSLACGAGIGYLAEKLSHMPVMAGVNTTFIGLNRDVGRWEEKCRACRDCLLTVTGGICPVATCPKGMLNGACGGSRNGKCETDPERDCAWALIYQRLEGQGRLGVLEAMQPARDHQKTLAMNQTHPAYLRRYSAHE